MKTVRNLSSSGNYDEKDYQELLHDTIAVIESSRVRIAKQINTSIISSHWEIGKLLEERKLDSKHGDQIVKRLSVDLKGRYPNMGLSPRNLWEMKRFYLRYYQEDTKLQRCVAVLSWRKNIILLDKKLSDEEIFYYATESIRKNWNKDLLINAIKMNSYSLNKHKYRDNNFVDTLPMIQAEKANEILKDSYNFGFLGLTEPVAELELEKRLIEKIKIFMLELGKGFAYIGNQYRLEYNGKEYFVDMLFSNRKLNCLVAIDLKIGEFKSEYVGKMNMYLSLLDKA